jgi:anti-sigma B factor antagonist
MARHPFEAKLRHASGKVVIDLMGEINAFAAEDMNDIYNQAEASGSIEILLNFSTVDYINSTGIALIVNMLGRARKTNRRLSLCGLSEHYVEIFKITRLTDYMDIYSDEQAALAAP